MRATKNQPKPFNLLLHGGTCLVLLTLVLSGCDSGGSGKDRESEPEAVRAEPKAMVSGRLHYEFVPSRAGCAGLDYSATQQRPIRGATVQLVDALSGQVLDATVAGEDGSYRLLAAPGDQVFVRVRAELKASSPDWDVEIRDNTRATNRPLSERPLYVLEDAPFELDSKGAQRQLIAHSGWNGNAYSRPRAAAPFAILDSLYTAMTWVRQADPDANFPGLDVFWSTNNGTLVSSGSLAENLSAGQIGTSFYSPDHRSMFLLGRADDDTEEFDSHVIIHEWGHYFEDVFSRSDSPGGSHNLRDPLDKRLAFSEGWATALSGMVLGSLYCDTSGPGQRQGFFIDMTKPPNHRTGWFSEWSMISLLYGLWSPAQQESGFDFAELYSVFAEDHRNTQAFTSIFSFAAALKQRYPERALLVDQRLSAYDINGTDAYGTKELNHAGSQQPDVLPIYKPLPVDGRGLEICVNDEFDLGRSGNKLAQFGYLRLQVERTGPYRLSVETLHPPTADTIFGCPGSGLATLHSDPDFRLLKNGEVLVDGIDCSANSEVAQLELSAGDYVLAVTEKRLGDPYTAREFPNRVCFEVKAAPLF